MSMVTLCIVISVVGCGAKVKEIEESTEGISNSIKIEESTEEIDNTPPNRKYFITSYYAELTGDTTKDRIDVYLNTGGVEEKDFSEATLNDFNERPEYYLNNNTEMFVKIVVTDGKNNKLLYTTGAGCTRSNNNLISIVHSDEKDYLMTGIASAEQKSYGIYYEVFNFRNDEINKVEAVYVDFAPDEENYKYHKENGRNIPLVADVLPEFKNKLSKWIGNSDLIVCCDMNFEESVYLSTEKKSYTANQYFEKVWKKYGIMEEKI